MNHTVFKDDVLEEFMQRAEEMEVIAGPTVLKEKTKPKKLTPHEQMEQAMKTNPHRFYTNTPFKQLMGL